MGWSRSRSRPGPLSMTDHKEVIIAGGGPAGLAAAIALRARNLKATVVDASEPRIEKVCGEGLLPETLETLRAIGVEPETVRGAPFRGVRYVANKNQAEAQFSNGHALG